MKWRLVSTLAVAVSTLVAASAQAGDPIVAPESAVDAALEAAADALEEAADATAASEEYVSASDLESDVVWKPITYYDSRIDDFLADAKPIAEGNAASREAVAAKYGLLPKALDELISFLLQMEKQGYERKQHGSLRSRAFRLPEIANRAPLSLMFAAGAISHLSANEQCSTADIKLLMDGSRDPDADLWAIASSCADSETFATAIERTARVRPALLYLMMNWTRTDAASDLALTDMLLRPEFLTLVEASERIRVHADIARYKLAKLLGAGLNNEAVAFGDSLEPALLDAVLGTDKGDIRAKIGGVALKTAPYRETLASDYAAALALANRQVDARAVLDRVAPAELRKRARVCLDAANDGCAVGEGDQQVPLAALLVDHFLDQPDADPYIFIEGQSSVSSSGLGSAGLLFCRLGLQASEQEECDRARQRAAGSLKEKEDDEPARALWAAIRRVGGQPFEMARAGYAARLEALGTVGHEEKKDWSRASIDPAPVAFRELPLPADVLAMKPVAGDDPESFAPLPAGHSPVRLERYGQRAAAISLSNLRASGCSATSAHSSGVFASARKLPARSRVARYSGR